MGIIVNARCDTVNREVAGLDKANDQAVPMSPELVLVYVVDDEPLVGELVVAFLKIKGYQTQLFLNAEAALAALAAAKPPPQVLVTDYAMEGLNGLQLIAQCRKLSPALKTILISGNLRNEELAKAVIQPDQFLRKPFLSSQLLNSLQAMVFGYRI